MRRRRDRMLSRGCSRLGSDLDYALEQSRIGGEDAELGRNVGERTAVSDPRSGVDLAGFHEVNDLGERARQGVATGAESELTAMEIGIVERHVALK